MGTTHEFLANKAQVLTTHRGIEDVNVAVKHVSSL